jgi:hypothetical protein
LYRRALVSADVAGDWARPVAEITASEAASMMVRRIGV